MLKKTAQQVEETKQWIQVVKKGKSPLLDATPTATIIIHIGGRVEKKGMSTSCASSWGLKPLANAEEDTKELYGKMVY